MPGRVHGWSRDNPDYMHLDMDDIMGFAYSTVDVLREPDGAVDDNERCIPHAATVATQNASIEAYEKFMQSDIVLTFLLSHQHNPVSDEILEDVVESFGFLLDTLFYATMLRIIDEAPYLTREVRRLKHLTPHKVQMILETLNRDLTGMFRARHRVFTPLGRHRPSHDLRVE
ncbi:hypothetical protein T484DRAFT_1755585 [Baffinella frigidus]|nr:hypothetical protein T484DRAFT_1755585 [Cryptophyta sp. CCMP2293]